MLCVLGNFLEVYTWSSGCGLGQLGDISDSDCKELKTLNNIIIITATAMCGCGAKLPVFFEKSVLQWRWEKKVLDAAAEFFRVEKSGTRPVFLKVTVQQRVLLMDDTNVLSQKIFYLEKSLFMYLIIYKKGVLLQTQSKKDLLYTL